VAQSEAVSLTANQPATNVKPAPEGPQELALSYCPSCSTRLASRSCKLICPGCGYYMSCSDFY